MIIDNSTALSVMKNDVEYFYYDIVDLKCVSNDIFVFATSIDNLMNHSFVLVRVYDKETLIEIHTDNVLLISEAISVAKEKKNSSILLSVAKDTGLSFSSETIPVEISEDQSHKHWGIFGAIKHDMTITDNKNVTISCPDQNDVDVISDLPTKEWSFLPARIKFIKNILIAKRENVLAGYLVYDSIEAGHYDIVMVYVHPNYRQSGVASALVKEFATVCSSKNGIAYYVCANSESSAKLAESLNIQKVREETIIYKLK